jgi:hypothetical protein
MDLYQLAPEQKWGLYPYLYLVEKQKPQLPFHHCAELSGQGQPRGMREVKRNEDLEIRILAETKYQQEVELRIQ